MWEKALQELEEQFATAAAWLPDGIDSEQCRRDFAYAFCTLTGYLAAVHREKP